MPKSFCELVHLASQNDQNAISELYQRAYNGVYRTVKTMIKDDDIALDITQDTFIKAFASLDNLHESEKFQSWINQIAANKSRDYLKKKRPTLFTEMENEDGEMVEFDDGCIDHLPEEVLDREETARLLKEILDTLRGSVDFHFYGDRYEWELIPAQETNSIRNDIISIKMGTSVFSPL